MPPGSSHCSGQLWKDLEATKEEVTQEWELPPPQEEHLGQSSASLLRQQQDNLLTPTPFPKLPSCLCSLSVGFFPPPSPGKRKTKAEEINKEAAFLQESMLSMHDWTRTINTSLISLRGWGKTSTQVVSSVEGRAGQFKDTILLLLISFLWEKRCFFSFNHKVDLCSL